MRNLRVPELKRPRIPEYPKPLAGPEYHMISEAKEMRAVLSATSSTLCNFFNPLFSAFILTCCKLVRGTLW